LTTYLTKFLKNRKMGFMSNGNEGLSPAEMEQMELIKKKILQRILTKEARERLNRVKMVKSELAMQIEMYLIQLYQAGKLPSKINDEQLKDILNMLSTKRNFNIVKK